MCIVSVDIKAHIFCDWEDRALAVDSWGGAVIGGGNREGNSRGSKLLPRFYLVNTGCSSVIIHHRGSRLEHLSRPPEGRGARSDRFASGLMLQLVCA
ncbi:MAG: hypothetical protein K0Q67_3265 [Cellvibrio sp.]|nr:hypothetical protein [Cellvibrio sp.]